MQHPTRLSACLAACVMFLLCLSGFAPSESVAKAADQPAKLGPDKALLQKARNKAADFLRSSQNDDGSWTSAKAPGITALVTTGLLQSGIPADDPMVAKALKHIEGFVQQDGGIYFSGTTHRNYETSIAVLAFHEANRDGRYNKTLAGAANFLRGLQWDEDEDLKRSDDGYGGAGYGSHERPDLSNTQFFVEALRSTGAKADDPSIQKALLFISRCQNLESEHNATKFASKINDGGFYYTIAAGGSSQAGVEANGGLRSYGSMTYAGLKSMIYAGLGPDDSRVKAATNWIQQHYTVRENPGMGQQGLYYYFHTFAKALSAMELDLLEDAQGVKHDWRKELAEHLVSAQRENGSWVNRQARWYEGDPNLVTAYTLMALSYCEPKSPAQAER